jgi:hypothetical protein
LFLLGKNLRGQPPHLEENITWKEENKQVGLEGAPLPGGPAPISIGRIPLWLPTTVHDGHTTVVGGLSQYVAF